MSTTQFLAKPAPGHENIVKEFYSDHQNFHDGDSGIDLFCLENTIIPGKSIGNRIYSGLCVEATRDSTPQSFYLYPRSSTGADTPIRMSNSVGIIDSGYRGQIIMIVDNVSNEPFLLAKGKRYFQMCSRDLSPVSFKLVEKLSETKRGENGIGSTNQ